MSVHHLFKDMTRPYPINPTRTRACSVKPYLTLASVLILMHVKATVGVFICGQTVCEGKGFDTCQPHPISGKICQPCRDFMEYCNSTSMPQGCNPYCLDQQKIQYEAIFLNITIEGDSLLKSFRAAQENFVKEKAILLQNITQAMEQIVILRMTIRNQTLVIDKMQNENHNVSIIINKAENYSTEIESRIFNQTQRIPEDKSTKTHREYQDTTLTMVLVAAISSICTAAIVISVGFLCRDRICKRKERSLNLQKGKSRFRRRNRTIWTKPTGPENEHNSKLITSCTTHEDTRLKRVIPC